MYDKLCSQSIESTFGIRPSYLLTCEFRDGLIDLLEVYVDSMGSVYGVLQYDDRDGYTFVHYADLDL